MNDPWLVAGKIVEAIDALSGNPESRPGVSALREEIARLKALNAKQAGEIAKKTAEISNLRKEAAELQPTASAEVTDRALDDMIKRKDEAMEQISKSNAVLRERVTKLEENAKRREDHVRDLHNVIISVKAELGRAPEFIDSPRATRTLIPSDEED